MGAGTVEKQRGTGSSQLAWVDSEGVAGVTVSREGNVE